MPTLARLPVNEHLRNLLAVLALNDLTIRNLVEADVCLLRRLAKLAGVKEPPSQAELYEQLRWTRVFQRRIRRRVDQLHVDKQMQRLKEIS